MSEWLPDLGPGEIVDIGVVALLCWVALRLLRRTRAQRALIGLATLGVIYFGARWLELELTATLFRGFFAVLVLVLVVVFQDDLRRVFEQIGSWRTRAAAAPPRDMADLLARSVARLAANRTGALIVIPGGEPIESHVEGGVELRGRVSEPLLLSLFDTSSPGHDGAVLMSNGNVERFALHLPLSSDHAQLGPGGTRHAAALGLSERCDALCIVVSEERGTISVAQDGTLRSGLRPEEVVEAVRNRQPGPASAAPRWRDSGLWLEGGGSVAVALLLWLALVPGSDLAESEVTASVVVAGLPQDLHLDAVDPKQLTVRLSGLRRDLVLVQPGSIAVRIDAELARLGRRTFAVDLEQVSHPPTLSVISIDPDQVRISVTPASPKPDPKPSAKPNPPPS